MAGQRRPVGQEPEPLTPAEVEMVREAMADARPALRGDAALEYLRQRAKALGLANSG